jgi:hypothetical protein
MIEKIFIPTVCRADRQVTYNSLPKSLQEKVVFVVQAWEREQYKYDAEYLVLPEDITLDCYNALSRTRRLIYEAGKNIQYCMIDDDFTFLRRNAKYWTGESNMEKSKRKCTDDDMFDMFAKFQEWLDSGVTVCGCGMSASFPDSKEYIDNTSVCGSYWINGKDFAEHLDDMHLTKVRTAEDDLLLLGLLTRGYRTRKSNEFIFDNHSVADANEKSAIWDAAEFESVHNDHKFIQSLYPKYFKILYDENGKREAGGYRDFGKRSIKWKQAYKDSQNTNTTLDAFFS